MQQCHKLGSYHACHTVPASRILGTYVSGSRASLPHILALYAPDLNHDLACPFRDPHVTACDCLFIDVDAIAISRYFSSSSPFRLFFLAFCSLYDDFEMWILESPGDFLGGKRLWLKPGKKYLFGRVKKDGVRFALDHKQVSRKHFIVDVAEVQDGEVGQVHTRTKIKIIDQNSKSGTTVNGQILKGTDLPSRDLDKAENSVRPGNAQELVIKWHPCVVTFNLQKKELKAGALKQKQDRVKALGIKAIAEFTSDSTTHLVVLKRNTAKGLQALISSRYIVLESFIDAVEYAATPTNLDAEEDASPLELDFDSAWPNAAEHLPPPGREPSVRPVENYQPGPDRIQIFQDYIFVFGDQAQYDNLLPAITTGHGKALMLKIVENETSVNEIYDYMLRAGGKKSSNGTSSQLQPGGAILVRWDSKSDQKEWTTGLINEVALRMNQRAVDQSEFLDAILANDAMLLKQTVPFESTTEGRVAPPPSMVASSFKTIRQSTQAGPRPNGNTHDEDDGTSMPRTRASEASPGASRRPSTHQRQQVEARTANSARHDNAQAERSATPAEGAPSQASIQSETPRRSRKDRFRRPPPVRKAFEDDFNPDDVADYELEEEEAEVKPEPEAVKEEPRSTRKRRRSPSPSQTVHEEETARNSFDEEMDELLPAATAMKRRKLELEAEAKRKGLPPPTLFDAAPAEPEPKKKKKEVEIDVGATLQAKREKEAEEERKRNEDLENLPPIDETSREPANLAVIETMEICYRTNKAPKNTSNRLNPEDDPRWDPKWNGKKNFKKFRPQSANPRAADGRAAKVIVPLIEVKKKSDGLGEKYWDKTEGQKEKDRKKKEKQRRNQIRASQMDVEEVAFGVSHGVRLNESDFENDSEDDIQQPRRRTQTQGTGESSKVAEVDRLQAEAEELLGSEVDMNEPRHTRSDDVRSRTQTQATISQGKKRPASSGKAAAAPKRQKTLPVTIVHGSDSDGEDSDDLKFKFGSKKKGKGRA